MSSAGSAPRKTAHGYPVRATRQHFAGRLFRVCTDEVEMPDGRVAGRDYLRHVGAVGVVAVDDAGQVVLVRQYRHALGRRLWELPAGLVDVPGEDAVDTAARELAEETDLRAGRWEPLVTVHTSPGCSDERVQIFLARDLSAVPHSDRHARRDEESELELRRVPLAEAVGGVLAEEITNAAAVAGLLAAARALGV